MDTIPQQPVPPAPQNSYSLPSTGATAPPASVMPTPQADVPSNDPQKTDTSVSSKKWAKIGIVVGIILVAIGGIVYFGKESLFKGNIKEIAEISGDEAADGRKAAAGEEAVAGEEAEKEVVAGEGGTEKIEDDKPVEEVALSGKVAIAEEAVGERYKCINIPQTSLDFCPGDKIGLSQDTPVKILGNASQCSGEAKCEAFCSSGFHWEINQCLPDENNASDEENGGLSASGDDKASDIVIDKCLPEDYDWSEWSSCSASGEQSRMGTKKEGNDCSGLVTRSQRQSCDGNSATGSKSNGATGDIKQDDSASGSGASGSTIPPNEPSQSPSASAPPAPPAPIQQVIREVVYLPSPVTTGQAQQTQTSPATPAIESQNSETSALIAPNETLSNDDEITTRAKAEESTALNRVAGTDASQSLHGAYIKGETGPGLLVYPLAMAFANVAYFIRRKRKK